jgi:hypothetical protein
MKKKRKENAQCHPVIFSLFPCRHKRDFFFFFFFLTKWIKEDCLIPIYIYGKLFSFFSSPLISLFNGCARTLTLNKSFILPWCWIEDDYCHYFFLLSRQNYRGKSSSDKYIEKKIISNRYCMKSKNITYPYGFLYFFLRDISPWKMCEYYFTFKAKEKFI